MMKDTTIMNRYGNLVTREQLIRSVASSSAMSNGRTTEENEKMLNITWEDGKYGVSFNEGTGELKATRYGECWRDLCGDGLVLSMLYQIKEHEEVLDSVWGACEKYGVDIEELLQMYEAEGD